MNDRELLELAAKANGMRLWFDDNSNPWYDGDKFIWNPLNDDGDALRLVVKLQMQILNFETLVTVQHCRFSDGFCGCDERYDGDRLAATRRAIVRAAAEIGRKM